MATYGVLVCYYSENKKIATNRLKNILNKVDDDNYLVIVNNTTTPIVYPNAEYELNGDNIGWEFGSWDIGYKYISSRIKNEDILIFANDTFCFNRHFSFFDEWLFGQAFKKIMKNNEMIIGELCELNENFVIEGVELKGWISTYLFGVSASKIRYLLPFHNQIRVLENCIDFEKREVHLSNVSDNLNAHLSRWLFPKDNQHGWYKAKKGSVEKELWKGKLQAIYNEKLFSAKSVLLGMHLYNVYGNRFFNLFGKILRKLVF
ncbi:hypothetical protein ACOJHK_001725 [Escherichia coli]